MYKICDKTFKSKDLCSYLGVAENYLRRNKTIPKMYKGMVAEFLKVEEEDLPSALFSKIDWKWNV